MYVSLHRKGTMILQQIWNQRLYIYGVLCLLIAIIYACLAIYKKRRCSARVSAVVSEVKTRSVKYRQVYLPICEYYVNGVGYNRTGPPHHDNVLPVGSTITIAYDPNRPRRSYIPGRDERIYRLRFATFVFASAVMFITGYLSSLI